MSGGVGRGGRWDWLTCVDYVRGSAPPKKEPTHTVIKPPDRNLAI
jgi:hypothetical protein